MIKFDFDKEVVATISKKMRVLSATAMSAAKNSVKSQAKLILKAAKNAAPKGDTGELRKSGKIDATSAYDEAGVTIHFGADGPSKAYALAVHEHLSEHSPASWKQAEGGTQKRDKKGRFAKHGVHFEEGGPKYLEIPFLAATGGFTQQVADDVAKKLELPESWGQFTDIYADGSDVVAD